MVKQKKTTSGADLNIRYIHSLGPSTGCSVCYFVHRWNWLQCILYHTCHPDLR